MKKETLMAQNAHFLPQTLFFLCYIIMWWSMEWRSRQTNVILRPSECCFCPLDSRWGSLLSSHYLQDTGVWGFRRQKDRLRPHAAGCQKYWISVSCTFLSQTVCGWLTIWCMTQIFLHFKARRAYIYVHLPEWAPECPKTTDSFGLWEHQSGFSIHLSLKNMSFSYT